MPAPVEDFLSGSGPLMTLMMTLEKNPVVLMGRRSFLIR